MHERPFGFDPLTGAKETIRFTDDGKIEIVTETDITDILQSNADARKDAPQRWGDSWDKDGESFIKFGSIPFSVYFNNNIVPQWMRSDTKELVKWLQEPEQEVFRTRGGKFV